MAEERAAASAAVKAPPSAAEQQLGLRQHELDHWRRNAGRLRGRNRITGLCIGAFVLGLFSYTIASVKQERVLDELDEEAKVIVLRGPRTGANS